MSLSKSTPERERLGQFLGSDESNAIWMLKSFRGKDFD
ncbi:hypothetical protein CKA32_000649 [Geitlerinema sp. FC II]|nr:hypothetical protein CKA32_000649 [Geitlerinema sp. FC II]